ncbi:hypothetical protein HNP84_002600 [Thermocatellispora tengchongensis]|uniref:Uncharacterized protein n=1 Tax=Thermocatellispora tengchongensis TaxID=1073253 RepID=A0A840P1L9_9ACTN|nr:hypothetical protein [Thermocatellispora tengchongensis]MBB5132879.1 hypothetical protein [Thermocatellispora tengchongensis]
MGTGQTRLDEIAGIEFHGKVAAKIAAYTVATQRFAHDLARELDTAESTAESAMSQLKGHPLLLGIDVRARAWRVARHLADARELAQGISAEAVKFNMQFRQEFLEAMTERRAENRKEYKGKVDL